MIAVLRLIGILNAAVWLGGAVFLTVAASPAVTSSSMQALLGERYFPYYSIAIEQLIWEFYFWFQITCALIAFLHLLAEWLYLGRPSRKLSFGLFTAIFLMTLVSGSAIQPKLKMLHTIRFRQDTPVAERQSASQTFRTLHVVLKTMNCFVIAGLVLYVWRVANTSDNARFISSVKFRG